jgi:hypothetical protein
MLYKNQIAISCFSGEKAPSIKVTHTACFFYLSTQHGGFIAYKACIRRRHSLTVLATKHVVRITEKTLPNLHIQIQTLLNFVNIRQNMV